MAEAYAMDCTGSLATAYTILARRTLCGEVKLAGHVSTNELFLWSSLPLCALNYGADRCVDDSADGRSAPRLWMSP